MSKDKSRIITGKIVAAATIGSLVEYYDFFIAATAAAIIWPYIMFPNINPAVVFLYSAILFVVAPATGPVGGYIFGHFGDKLGRKFSLIITLILMGVGALGVGLTPTYAAIGIAAPILILIFRITEGIGIGGETGNSFLVILEYVYKSKWRAFWTSFVHSAGWLGVLTSSLFFGILASVLPSSALLDWGWRIPFFVGSIVILIGIYFRYRIAETPLFMEVVKKRREIVKRPANEAFKKYLEGYNIRCIFMVLSWCYSVLCNICFSKICVLINWPFSRFH